VTRVRNDPGLGAPSPFRPGSASGGAFSPQVERLYVEGGGTSLYRSAWTPVTFRVYTVQVRRLWIVNIYVGNMSYGTSEDELRTLFEEHGTVDAVRVITDRDTGRPKGFAFVEMGGAAEAEAAVQALNGKDVDGRSLTVNEARPRNERGGGGGGGGGRGRW